MNALRLLIGAMWLLVSAVGGAAMAMPAAIDPHPMACHQEEGQTSPSDNGLQHQAMPCCAHLVSAPPPLLAGLSLSSVPLHHRIEPQPQPRDHNPYLEPDPPRNV